MEQVAGRQVGLGTSPPASIRVPFKYESLIVLPNDLLMKEPTFPEVESAKQVNRHTMLALIFDATFQNCAKRNKTKCFENLKKLK